MSEFLLPSSANEYPRGRRITFPDGTEFIEGFTLAVQRGHVVIDPEGTAVEPPIKEASPSKSMIEDAIHDYHRAHGEFPIHILND